MSVRQLRCEGSGAGQEGTAGNNAGKGNSPGCSQPALPGKPPAAPSPRREETRSLQHQRRVNSSMHWQTRAACPAAYMESLWRDPYIVKLYGITVPPSCLVPGSCSLSLALPHTLTAAHRGAPGPRIPVRGGRCPGSSRLGSGWAPAASRALPAPRLPARLTLMLALLAPPPPPRRISSEWLFLG